MSEMMAVLRKMFGDIPEAVEVYVPRWNLDPFVQGSYADWPVGSVSHFVNPHHS